MSSKKELKLTWQPTNWFGKAELVLTTIQCGEVTSLPACLR